jgi:hypothetical protein
MNEQVDDNILNLLNGQHSRSCSVKQITLLKNVWEIILQYGEPKKEYKSIMSWTVRSIRLILMF